MTAALYRIYRVNGATLELFREESIEHASGAPPADMDVREHLESCGRLYTPGHYVAIPAFEVFAFQVEGLVRWP